MLENKTLDIRQTVSKSKLVRVRITSATLESKKAVQDMQSYIADLIKDSKQTWEIYMIGPVVQYKPPPFYWAGDGYRYTNAKPEPWINPNFNLAEGIIDRLGGEEKISGVKFKGWKDWEALDVHHGESLCVQPYDSDIGFYGSWEA